MSYKVLLLSLICFVRTIVSRPNVEISPFYKKHVLQDPATDALNRLLKNVTFSLPDFNIEESIVDMRLTNILCFNISLKEILVSGDAGEKTYIAVNVSGVALSCTMDWDLRSPLSGTGTCNADASSCSMNVSAIISDDEFKVPTSAHMGDENCAVSLVFSLHFSGDSWITTFLLNTVTSWLTSSLEKEINTLICQGQGAFPGLENLVNTNLTEILGIVSTKLDPFLNGTQGPFQPLTPPTLSSGKQWANYNKGEVIKLLDHLVNARANGMPYLNEFMWLLTSGSGTIAMDNRFNITIEIPDDRITVTNITIQSLDFYGINTFNVIDILEPVPTGDYQDYPSNHSLYFDIEIERLGFNVGGLVTLAPSKTIHGGKTIVEHAHANVSFSDIKIKMVMQVGIEMDKLGKMPIGKVLQHLLPCFLSLVQNASVQMLDITVGSYVPPQIYGFSGVAPLFNEIINALTDLFKPIALDLIHGVAGTDGLILANELLAMVREKLHGSNNSCSEYVPVPVEKRFLNFKELPLLQFASKFLNVLFTASADTSPLGFGLDEYIDSFFEDGTLIDNGTLINFNKHLSGGTGFSHIEFKLGKLMITGMDSFDELKALKATGPYSLDNSIDIKQLNISFFLDVVLEGAGVNDGAGSYNHFWINIDFSKMGFGGELEIKIDENEIAGLNASEFLSCFLLLPESLNVTSVDLHIGLFNFFIDCVDCETEKMNEWDKQLKTNTSQAAWNSGVQKFMNFLMTTPEGGSEPTLTYGLNEFLNSAMESAPWQCGGAPVPPPESDPVSLFDETFLIASFSILGLIGIGIAYFCCWKPFRQDINNTEINAISPKPLILADGTMMVKYNYNEAWGCHCRSDDTLCLQNVVPTWMRYGMICWLVFAIAMFIFAHTSTGASVNLTVHAAGDKIQLPALFDFDLANSIRDMFNARVYVLGLLIAVFSGAWPYIKLIMLLCCWVLPVPNQHRGRWLYWLDILGKYSMIDAFVLIILMVAFRFHAATPMSDALPEDFFIIDVYCVPGWGIFGFLIAAVQSLIATHVIIYYHKESTIVFNPDVGTVKKEALRNHKFECRDGEGVPVKVKVTVVGQVALVLCILCSILLLLAGATVDSFEFHYGGMAGVVLSDPNPQFSQLSLANNMLGQDVNLGTEALWFIFILLTFIIPVVHLVVLIVMWLVPLSLSKQRDLLITVEVFQAWASLEVFVIALFAAVLETPQFVGFIIGDKCDAINKILVLFLAEGKVDPECFTVTTKMLKGSWILFACCVVYIVGTQVIERLASRAVAKRMKASGMNQQGDQFKKQETAYSRSDAILPTCDDAVYSFLRGCCCIKPHGEQLLARFSFDGGVNANKVGSCSSPLTAEDFLRTSELQNETSPKPKQTQAANSEAVPQVLVDSLPHNTSSPTRRYSTKGNGASTPGMERSLKKGASTPGVAD